MMGKKHVFYSILFALLFIFNEVSSQDEGQKIIQFAGEFLQKLTDPLEADQYGMDEEFQRLYSGNDIIAYAFNLEPKGFIIVTKHQNICRVAGYSLENKLPGPADLYGSPVFAIVSGISHGHRHQVHYEEIRTLKKGMRSVSDNGPFMETMWGQVNCKDEQNHTINVTNLFTPGNYAAGCVAISFATVMHHYQWPPLGMGAHTYADERGSSTGTYSANFGDTPYAMQDMKYLYNHVESAVPERKAAGELAFHAAVALEMDFESKGSTSNVNRISKAAMDHFRYYSYYKDVTSPVFWERLDKNMSERIPVILAIEASNGAGHSIVCDGLNYGADQAPYYHLNMGWWGAGNGWFSIRDEWQSGGYSKVIGGVLDMVPLPVMEEIVLLPDDQLRLTWSTASWPLAEMFEIQQKTGNDSWEILDQACVDTSFVTSRMDPESVYTFRVRARMNEQWYPGSWSNQVVYGSVSALPEEERLPEAPIIYPNPFPDQFFIEGAKGSGTIEVMDLTGSIRYSQPMITGKEKYTIPAESWKKGIYIVRIREGNLEIVKKIIKQ